MEKYIECHNCENHYDCERTSLGGCMDGKEFEDEQAKTYKQKAIEEMATIISRSRPQYAKMQATALVNAGYGDLRAFAEKFKDKLAGVDLIRGWTVAVLIDETLNEFLRGDK